MSTDKKIRNKARIGTSPPDALEPGYNPSAVAFVPEAVPFNPQGTKISPFASEFIPSQKMNEFPTLSTNAGEFSVPKGPWGNPDSESILTSAPKKNAEDSSEEASLKTQDDRHGSDGEKVPDFKTEKKSKFKHRDSRVEKKDSIPESKSEMRTTEFPQPDKIKDFVPAPDSYSSYRPEGKSERFRKKHTSDKPSSFVTSTFQIDKIVEFKPPQAEKPKEETKEIMVDRATETVAEAEIELSPSPKKTERTVKSPHTVGDTERPAEEAKVETRENSPTAKPLANPSGEEQTCEGKRRQYTIPEIARANRDPQSWIKPLEVVKVWIRDLRVENKQKLLVERKPPPFEEIKDVSWRREVSNEMKRLMEGAEQRKKLMAEEKTEEEKTEREIKLTLNKLSPGNIGKLQEKLLQIILVKTSFLDILVRNIFIKACQESKYTSIYADLCEWLISEHSKAGPENEKVFKRSLLEHCQNLFEQPGHDKVKINGNVRLIAELYLRDIITLKVLLWCTTELISLKLTKNEDVELTTEDLDEDRLEGAFIFLKTASPKIAKIYSKVRDRLYFIIKHLQQIVDRKLVSKRLHFLTLNILELHMRDWKNDSE